MKTPDEHISKVGRTDSARGVLNLADEAPDAAYVRPALVTMPGQTDIVASLTGRVPALTFTRMFGLPEERGPEYADWNHTLFRGQDPERSEAAGKIIGALTELVERPGVSDSHRRGS